MFFAISCLAYADAQTVIPLTDFSFSDFGIDNRTEYGIFTYDMKQISILLVGTEYQIIQKVDFQAKDLRNATDVNATVGYAIQMGDKMIHPPMGDNVTDAEHQKFAQSIPAQNEAFYKQSLIGDSYDFVVDVENPFYIKFPIQFNNSGQYTRQYYKITHMFEGPSGFGMGGLSVVDQYSKAINENGRCKNDSLRLLIKHDYSNLVCVDPASAINLKERGWAL
ncbi:hypothetical protein YTPLAS73_09690 [Nitrosarchaeum sp.]|nr:hypothetical protein YTPLAS73_09690 [Nitrosarchaeum sp.]